MYLYDFFPTDYIESVMWLRKAVEGEGWRCSDAQYKLGLIYEEGRRAHNSQFPNYYIPQDYREAEKWFRMAAERGHDDAQYKMGDYCERRSDYVEAIKWYRMAAERGHTAAQIALGSIYGLGRGVPRDYVESAKWYRMAADKGNSKALFELAAYFLSGLGVSPDISSAKWLYEQAAASTSGGGGNYSDYARQQLTKLGVRFK